MATIIGSIAEGRSAAYIVAGYPDLEAADVREALLFAAEAVRERVLPRVSAD